MSNIPKVARHSFQKPSSSFQIWKNMLSRWWLHIFFNCSPGNPERWSNFTVLFSRVVSNQEFCVFGPRFQKPQLYTNFFETNRWTKPTGRQNKVTPERHSVWRNAGANGRFRDERNLGDLKSIKIHKKSITATVPPKVSSEMCQFLLPSEQKVQVCRFFFDFCSSEMYKLYSQARNECNTTKCDGTSHWQFQTRFFIHHHVPSVFWGFLKGWKFSLIFFVYHIRSVVGWVNWPDTLTGCFFDSTVLAANWLMQLAVFKGAKRYSEETAANKKYIADSFFLLWHL